MSPLREPWPGINPRPVLRTAPLRRKQRHIHTLSLPRVCGMQGIRHSGFSVCSPGNQGVFKFMNITWLGSPEELRAIPEAPLFLLQCRNSPDINISWYFHEETLAFLGSGFRRCALCEGRAAASAAPSTHSAAPKSLPWASFTFKTHLYLELFSLKKIKFWLLSNTLSGLS